MLILRSVRILLKNVKLNYVSLEILALELRGTSKQWFLVKVVLLFIMVNIRQAIKIVILRTGSVSDALNLISGFAHLRSDF